MVTVCSSQRTPPHCTKGQRLRDCSKILKHRVFIEKTCFVCCYLTQCTVNTTEQLLRSTEKRPSMHFSTTCFTRVPVCCCIFGRHDNPMVTVCSSQRTPPRCTEGQRLRDCSKILKQLSK